MVLKNLSFGSVIAQFKRLLMRFPVVLAITIVGTVSFIFLVNYNDSSWTRESLIRILQLCILALPWVMFATLMAEKYRRKPGVRLLIQLGAAIIASMYYFLLPDSFQGMSPEPMRLALLTIVGVILVI